MNSSKFAFFFLFLSSIALFSCNIETAKAPKNKQIIILSDYLTQSDTSLFLSFLHEENVSMQIVQMQADKIIGLIRNEGANIHADVIMVKTMSDVHKMSKRSLLQRINFSKDLTQEQGRYASWLYDFVGYGIDPFIVASTPKRKVRIYNDLLESKFVNELNEKETISMLSPIMNKLKKVDANKWVKKFSDSSVSKSMLLDSLNRNFPVLTLYSDFSSNKDTLLDYSNRYLRYPNSKSTGSFFNLRTIAIINQAQNYSVAKDFIFYCLDEENNRSINKSLNTFPIYSSKEVFRKYSVSQEKLVEYNQIIARLLKKVN